tara:strand:- start:157 stop:660 length:504 start_codon:yes stop_codon:yes gene_type:complete
MAGQWGDHFMGIIYGRPQAMQRHRCARNGRAYLPEPTRKALKKVEDYVKDKLKEHNQKAIPAGVPIHLHIVFIHEKPLRVPKSYQDKWSQKKWKSTTYRIAKTTKPDLDNLIKLIFDGCTNGGMWIDDNQITSINAYDFYAGQVDDACTIFRVSIEEEHMPQKKTGI